MSIGQRMKQARKVLGKTQAELARELGVSRPFLSIVEIDKQRLNSDVLTILQERFNINASWLLTGSGNMFVNTDDVYTQAQKQGMDAKKLLALEEFLKLNEPERLAVLTFAERLHRVLVDKENATEPNNR